MSISGNQGRYVVRYVALAEPTCFLLAACLPVEEGAGLSESHCRIYAGHDEHVQVSRDQASFQFKAIAAPTICF